MKNEDNAKLTGKRSNVAHECSPDTWSDEKYIAYFARRLKKFGRVRIMTSDTRWCTNGFPSHGWKWMTSSKNGPSRIIWARPPCCGRGCCK